MSVIAIDFGTSGVRAALARNGTARPIEAPDGSGEVAAVVSFTGGGIALGHSALAFGITAPTATVRGVKSWLGAGLSDAAARRAGR